MKHIQYICPATMLNCLVGCTLTVVQQVIVRNPEMSLEFMYVALFLLPVSRPKGSDAASETRARWTLSLSLRGR